MAPPNPKRANLEVEDVKYGKGHSAGLIEYGAYRCASLARQIVVDASTVCDLLKISDETSDNTLC